MTRGLVRAWILGAVLVLGGCGSDSEGDSTPKVPTLSLASLTSSEGSEWDYEKKGSDGELVLPCDGRIVVGLETSSNWSARAPGGCGLTQLCGHVEAVATAASGATSNAFAVSSPLLRLPVDTLGDWVGSGTVLARLVRDDNTPYLDPTGAEITATQSVTFSEAVGCDDSSGTGGAGGGSATGGTDAGGTGAGGTGATGGAGSSTAGETGAGSGAGGAAN